MKSPVFKLQRKIKEQDMVTIDLDPVRERHLGELARIQGQDVSLLACQILSDYLDFAALPESEDDGGWAESSVALAAEVLEPEDWSDDATR
jgi:predicted transcriptional regulator